MSDMPESPKISLPLSKQKAVLASWKPLLANWAVPGLGYWLIGEKGRAQALFGVTTIFCLLAYLQLTHGVVNGAVGGVFTPQLQPLEWMPTLGSLATVGVGPLYVLFANTFGGSGSEPVRNLTQEYGATYLLVAGLLNWLCCFDIFDRATGRWVWRLAKDEQEGLMQSNSASKPDPEA